MTPGRLRQPYGCLRLVTFLLLVALLPACVSGPSVRASHDDEEQITESHCEPATGPTAEIVPVSGGAPAYGRAALRRHEVDPAELATFSPRAQQIATIIGVQALLIELRLLEEEIGRGLEGASVRYLAVRQELSDRLLLALFEARSIAAELECEKERSEDIAARLEEIRNDVQQGRTVMAILADSISGVFAGTFLLLGSEVLSGVIDLSGSVAALGFGVAALGGDQTYELRHTRNLMADVWQGDESPKQFPDPVWRYLNWPLREGSKRTRRDSIVWSWRERLGKPGSKQERRRADLFFGGGGIYRIAELRYRSEMLGLLKTHVNLMTQDLNLLFRETLHRRPVGKENPT
ncbi:hypothetical protein [Nitrospira sp. Nam74]